MVQMFRPAGFAAGAARPSRDEVEAAARTLLRWAESDAEAIGAADITALLAGAGVPAPALNRTYPKGFAAGAGLPRRRCPTCRTGPRA